LRVADNHLYRAERREQDLKLELEKLQNLVQTTTEQYDRAAYGAKRKVLNEKAEEQDKRMKEDGEKEKIRKEIVDNLQREIRGLKTKIEAESKEADKSKQKIDYLENAVKEAEIGKATAESREKILEVNVRSLPSECQEAKMRAQTALEELEKVQAENKDLRGKTAEIKCMKCARDFERHVAVFEDLATSDNQGRPPDVIKGMAEYEKSVQKQAQSAMADRIATDKQAREKKKEAEEAPKGLKERSEPEVEILQEIETSLANPLDESTQKEYHRRDSELSVQELAFVKKRSKELLNTSTERWRILKQCAEHFAGRQVTMKAQSKAAVEKARAAEKANDVLLASVGF
jgi:hypothetical protein